MRVTLSQYDLIRSARGIDYLLRSKGLNTSKRVTEWIRPDRNFDKEFRGTPLPCRIEGCVKTVVGLVPKTIPWESNG